MRCFSGSNRRGRANTGAVATGACVYVVYYSVEWFGLRGAGSQQGREFLEQFLYLGREGGDGGCGLRASEAIRKIVTCLSEGAARGRVQDLPFSGENR